ncbi:MAG: hypothetical protein VB144_01100 [Clostridia bacterium]|nr:hypothetical protein [Clostridia bacterium]
MHAMVRNARNLAVALVAALIILGLPAGTLLAGGSAPDSAQGAAAGAARESAATPDAIPADWVAAYESGQAVAVRSIITQLSPGINRLVLTGIPGTVDSGASEITVVSGKGVIAAVSKRYDPTNGELAFNVMSDSEGPATFRVIYAFSGLNWMASYSALLGAADESAEILGWCTVSNRTTADISCDRLTLVAGPANALPGKADYRGGAALGNTVKVLSKPDPMPSGSYSHIQLFRAENVPARLVYVVDRVAATIPDAAGTKKEEKPVMLALDIPSPKDGAVPFPLPAGKMMVYSRSRDGSAYLLGADTLPASPHPAQLLVRLGKASQLRAEKVRTDQKKVGSSSWEEAYQVRITNQGQQDVEVIDIEELPGEWTMLQSTPSTWTKGSGGLALFTVQAPAGGQAEILFRVRYTI